MDWTVEQALHQFLDLSRSAFSKRELLRYPVFKDVAQLFCSYRYKSDGIDDALIKAFGNDPLFGQRRTALEDRVKVGVVAGIRGDHRPYLFANYNRNRNPQDEGMIKCYLKHDSGKRMAVGCLVVRKHCSRHED
jgi:hypothetical protein